MEAFKEVVSLVDRLRGPQGCPWDQKQTYLSLQPYLIEEMHEVLEAVDEGSVEKMVEELGDLLYVILFYVQIGKVKKEFDLEAICKALKEKIIRRHPHVFGEKPTQNMEEIIAMWEQVKKTENPSKGRKSKLDGIPQSLPLLVKAQKILQKLLRTPFPDVPTVTTSASENELAEELLVLIIKAEKAEVDLESAFRRRLGSLEARFKKWEMDLKEK